MIERFANEEGTGFTAGWSATSEAEFEATRRTSRLRRAIVTALMGVSLGWAILAVGALALLLGVVVAMVRGGQWLARGRTEEPSILREARAIVEHAREGV